MSGPYSTPSKNRRFFLYDPEGDGLMFFQTVEERDAAAKKAIADYCDPSDGWHDSVEGVVAGEVSHVATQTDRQDRPSDPEEAEEEGWADDCDYRCNYELKPVEGA